MAEPWFQWKLVSGKSLVMGNTTMTPQSRLLALRFPFGGLVWQRPAAVLVEQNGRSSERLPIQDVTRTAVLALAVVSAAISLAIHKRGKK